MSQVDKHEPVITGGEVLYPDVEAPTVVRTIIDGKIYEKPYDVVVEALKDKIISKLGQLSMLELAEVVRLIEDVHVPVLEKDSTNA